MKIIIVLISFVITGSVLYAYNLLSEDKPLGCAVVTEDITASQASTPPDTVSDPNNITTLSLYNDTLFLRRKVDTIDEWVNYNYVYIEKDRSSKYYRWLTSFQFDDYDSMSLAAYGLEGISSIDDLPSNTNSGLPKNWIPLYQLNGEYFIYKPSDFGNAGRRILTNQFFIKWYMDGLMPFEIVTQNTEGGNYNFELKVYNETRERLRIHTIDKEKQIYWFENPDEGKQEMKRLYIPANRAFEYDLIVNTGNYKAREIMFDGMVMKQAPVSTNK